MTASPPLPCGTLYVVATPLGNLEDITLRAVRILREVSLVACEDTRRTAVLLRAHDIHTATTSFFEHNERAKGDRLLDALRSGKSVALVSDAGTPGISDPGYRLVREARRAGLAVIPVPGPSAAVAALSVSGLPTDRFLFVGFLPGRSGERQRALCSLAGVKETLVVYEAPTRVRETLADMQEAWGDRDAFLCREATKVHEEYVAAPLSQLALRLGARDTVRGEIVLVVAGAGEPPPMESLEEAFARHVALGRTRREAVKEAAKVAGIPAREAYRRLLPRSADGE